MKRSTIAVAGLALISVLAGPFGPSNARADEGGVSFWVPGQQGSLAAAPAEPGWALPLVYYHLDADANGAKDFAVGGRIAAGVDARADLVMLVPTYVFTTAVAGGQGALGFAAVLGDMHVGAAATLTGPGGAIVTKDESDSTTAVGDLYPTFSIKWNHGVHNAMLYFAAGVPVGNYKEGRLANLGLNHWSADSGGAYTFYNPKSGHEFSLTGGLTYNFENPDTDYQNGVDAHVDLAWSEFVTQQTHVGMAAYAYHQLSGDSGSGAKLGDFESAVYGIGPQVGHIFPCHGKHGYFNFRAYYEFGADHRLEGWNSMVTVAIPIGRGAAQ